MLYLNQQLGFPQNSELFVNSHIYYMLYVWLLEILESYKQQNQTTISETSSESEEQKDGR